jgi:hypothetical protein
VPLFLDRLPLHCGPNQRWCVSLPVFITEPGLTWPPAKLPVVQRWDLDTGFSGEAFCRRSHLEAAGLDPDTALTGTVGMKPAFGLPQRFPIRDAEIWLVSNIPALARCPWRLELNRGIAFRTSAEGAAIDSGSPLLGMALFRRAGLRVHVDFDRGVVSIWTPGPWRHALGLFVRRTFTGFRRLGTPW